MKAQIIAALVSAMLKVFTPELLKDYADQTLDFIEDKVAGTKSPVDDMVLLPLCSMVRKAFDIPDDD